MASERITIRIPGELGERLRARSRLRGQTESAVLRQALEIYFGQPDGDQSAYEMAEEAGLIGCVQEAPKDLSSDSRHMKGFGKGRR